MSKAPGLDTEAYWQHIHGQRRALAEILGGLSPDQWEQPSLCEGWCIRDVAAHAISAPQLRMWGMPAMAWRGRFSMDRMGLVDGQRRGRAPIDEILGQYTTYDGSRHQMIGTHPLPDVLVHTQDVVRALGLGYEMPLEAALAAAKESIPVAWVMGAGQLVKHARFKATDVDWTHGRGPTIEGPIQELLMVISGRGRVATDLSGDGTAWLSGAAQA